MCYGGVPSSEALYPCLLTVHALEFTLPSVWVNTSLREESWQLFASFTQQSSYFPSKLENKSDVPLYSKLHLPFPLSSLTFLNVIIILSSWLRKYPFSFVLPIYCVPSTNCSNNTDSCCYCVPIYRLSAQNEWEMGDPLAYFASSPNVTFFCFCSVTTLSASVVLCVCLLTLNYGSEHYTYKSSAC